MQPLGVGLVYLAELDALFREGHPDLAVLELEPETFWDKVQPSGRDGAPLFMPNVRAMARIASLPQHKLVHSVGFPVGGTCVAAGDYVTPLADTVTLLDAAWASEHLSFNAIRTGNGIDQIGFLLPPRQTRAGADVAIANLRRLAASMPAPFAFETGVNYLAPRRDELSDGAFFARIAEGADCGILLDLHNLWANERNGRQSVLSVLDELPLERVWEVHLAGGMRLGTHYLDAHSGAVDDELLDLAARVLPRLPNLGALMFEILPGYLPKLGIDGVREQLGVLGQLWRGGATRRVTVPRDRTRGNERPADGSGRAAARPEPREATQSSGHDGGSDAAPWSARHADVAAWERELGALAIGRVPMPADRSYGLARDPAIPVLRQLIGEFRAGRIARALHYTTMLLLRHLGPEPVHSLLDAYGHDAPPDVFTSGEADRFAAYLRARLDRLPPVPHLAAVLAFEHALVRAALYGERSRIEWTIDPAALFEALDRNAAIDAAPVTPFAMDIVPEG